MAPVAKSAFEVYQELKINKKKANKPRLQQQQLFADIQEYIKDKPVQVQKAETNKSKSVVIEKKMKAVKKKVKRLGAADEAKKPRGLEKQKTAADSKQTSRKRRHEQEERVRSLNAPRENPRDAAKANGGKTGKKAISPVSCSSKRPAVFDENSSGKKAISPVSCSSKRPAVFDENSFSSEESEESSSEEEVTVLKQTEEKKDGKGEKSAGKVKAPVFLFDDSVPIKDSCQAARETLQWLLAPILVEPFLAQYWEQRPLFISRSHHRNYLEGILSCEDIDRALHQHSLQFTRNIDVTSYTNGQRETHNPVGRAHAYTVWDYYRNGCSVRILNPQTYFPRVRKACTLLQDCFNSFVGANVYLTPPNSQGFAPHYDDIEAFVLQLEGRKLWKVYPPRKGEKLPRTSSRNFGQDEMPKPILEAELQPGDLLYMPRGFVHQASTIPDTHSLHITLSTYQHNSWADLMEKVVPAALESAIASDPEFRQGIPWDLLGQQGVMYSTDETAQRKKVADKVRHLLGKLFAHAPVDAAADQMAKELLHEALPPMLQKSEVALTVHGEDGAMRAGDVGHLKQLTLDSDVKLVRRNVLRLVSEDDDSDTVRIYHCAENPLVYKDDDIKWCEVPVELAPAIEALVRNYPNFTRIADFPIEEDDKKVPIAMTLWERGMLISKDPLPDVSLSED